MHFQVVQILLLLILPYLLTRLTLRLGTQDWLSPVVLCYIFGIGLRNLTPLPLDTGISNFFSQATIVLAIPLLLYSTDLIGWFKLAKTTVISFGLVIMAVVVASLSVGWFFHEKMPESWLLSGMMTGVFIGGTPNMNAVGIALEASEETFITLNAAEIVCGGIYLVFLTSIAHRVFGFFLPDFKGDKNAGEQDFLPKKLIWRDVLLAFGLTIVLAAGAAGLTYLFTGALEDAGLLILMLSTFSVAASFAPRVRNLQGAFESGEYLLLMFCIAIGMLADFSEIFYNGGWYIAFSASVMLLAVVLHVLLCRLFGIDRDTMMITQTAGIYGPPFIGQVAAVIHNRSLVFSGIATGLVGLAVANFFGVLVGRILESF